MSHPSNTPNASAAPAVSIATEDIDEEELDRQIEQYESGDSLPNLHRRSSASKLAVLVDNTSQQNSDPSNPNKSAITSALSPEPEADAKAIVAECRLGRFEAGARELAEKYPPQFFHGNKKFLYQLACPKGAASLSGTVTIARWGSVPLPNSFPAGPCCALEYKEGPFEYFQSTADTVHWTANFADRHLFFAYGSALFAQDEIQVAEHPVLASVREYMVAAKDAKVAPLTIDNGSESPVLIMGVERRVQVATDVNAKEGRPSGLYGNNFAGASQETVKKATHILNPPIVSNIFAFTAPAYGAGIYTVKQLTQILCTAHSTFIAARLESYQQRAPDVPAIVIHTGNWGTGAFGGNKIIMALLQMAAARLALTAKDRAVHYTFAADGSAAYRAAAEVFRALVPEGTAVPVVEFIKKVHDLHYTWGHSNGT